jgi:hypothetical protein
MVRSVFFKLEINLEYYFKCPDTWFGFMNFLTLNECGISFILLNDFGLINQP